MHPKTHNPKRQPRPRYIAYVASSIDGRISLTEKSRPTWTSKEDWSFFQKSLSRADAVVVGRNTYEAAASRLKKRNTFVLTSAKEGLGTTGSVTFLNPKRVDLASVLSDYREVAIVGGSRVYQEMLDHGMLDELYVTIEPLVFGRGKPMFEGGTKNARLNLVSVKKLNTKGTLLLHYKI